ncbi:uncharacterized protein LOC121048854 isoform X2 [Rosa chinensis]|uniref:uncharacterized protein LOC121048854 isoform X2 n=1 Tax=Rosa chinensis TaxID=74649 RepID=UPI000D095BC9|nr:uncharacterized protein LOC121048854 isoform X2 [Rosa chinensis]
MEHDSLGVRDGLTGWVSSCLTVADELATSLRTGDIGPFNVGRSLPSLCTQYVLYFPVSFLLLKMSNFFGVLQFSKVELLPTGLEIGFLSQKGN